MKKKKKIMNKIQENAPIWTKFCINKKANKKMGGGAGGEIKGRHGKRGKKHFHRISNFFLFVFLL
jgi:hypothetical protein